MLDLIKIRMKTFDSYGLNNLRSFISPPKCKCGCNDKTKIFLNDTDELFEFCVAALEEHDCPESAIFAYAYDDNMYAIIYTEDVINVVEAKNPDMEFFKNIDAELRLCCYGIMIETSPGEWEVLEY